MYFAAYPTICDTVERHIITDRGLFSRQGDWGHISSTISRVIFYFGNLNLGDDLEVITASFDEVDNHALIHTSLLNKNNGNLLARIFKKRLLLTYKITLLVNPISKKYPSESALINNGGGVKNLIDLCAKNNIPQLIFISTCSNCRIVNNHYLANEDHELNPLSLRCIIR